MELISYLVSCKCFDIAAADFQTAGKTKQFGFEKARLPFCSSICVYVTGMFDPDNLKLQGQQPVPGRERKNPCS